MSEISVVTTEERMVLASTLHWRAYPPTKNYPASDVSAEVKKQTKTWYNVYQGLISLLPILEGSIDVSG